MTDEKFIICTKEELFPDSIKKLIDNNTIKKYPFLSTFLKKIVDQIYIDKHIETYDELVDFFENELECEDYENDRAFNKYKKRLNNDYDIFIVTYEDIGEDQRDFLFNMDKSTNHFVEELY